MKVIRRLWVATPVSNLGDKKWHLRCEEIHYIVRLKKDVLLPNDVQAFSAEWRNAFECSRVLVLCV